MESNTAGITMKTFGGERLSAKNNLSYNNLLEHVARYEHVQVSKKNVVLDVGCGTGYGTALLARKCKKIVGIDISEQALQQARQHFARINTSFLQTSATKMPFQDNSFDIAVAFEVLEHIQKWKLFLQELQRVVKPNGKIYISTPNKDIYNPWSKKPINPYHKFEMRVDEFKKALKMSFFIDQLLGQRTPVYNDHWIWNVVDPLLFYGRFFIPYKMNNAIKLTIINWIKPKLDKSDIIFSADPHWVKKSRVLFAICTNSKAK